MRFYNHKSSAIFDIYLKLYDSELSFEKKKLIFKSLLVGESWSWKVTGISKLCLESFKKNKFEKSRKLKTKRQTVKNVVRHQLTNIDDTIKDILSGIRSACTYVGANRLKTLSKCTTFVRVHNTHNTIYEN